jgi:xylose dehydrogenase (NAD/NADP)
MTVRKVRWGLISTARINERLIPVIRQAERSELVAIASRDGERAKSYAKQWNIPHAYQGYDALLADPDIDAVYVSLPNGFHAEWSIKSANAGKHVLCEKPLALTVTDVDRMIEA